MQGFLTGCWNAGRSGQGAAEVQEHWPSHTQQEHHPLCVINCFAGHSDGHERSGFLFQCLKDLKLQTIPHRCTNLGYALVDKTVFLQLWSVAVTQCWPVGTSLCHPVLSTVNSWSILPYLWSSTLEARCLLSTGKGCSFSVILRAEDMPKHVSFVTTRVNLVIWLSTDLLVQT